MSIAFTLAVLVYRREARIKEFYLPWFIHHTGDFAF
jgi:hypothetical protein